MNFISEETISLAGRIVWAMHHKTNRTTQHYSVWIDWTTYIKPYLNFTPNVTRILLEAQNLPILNVNELQGFAVSYNQAEFALAIVLSEPYIELLKKKKFLFDAQRAEIFLDSAKQILHSSTDLKEARAELAHRFSEYQKIPVVKINNSIIPIGVDWLIKLSIAAFLPWTEEDKIRMGETPIVVFIILSPILSWVFGGLFSAINRKRLARTRDYIQQNMNGVSF